LVIIVAIVALIAGGNYGWRHFQSKRQAAAKPAAADPASVPEKSVTTSPTPSETLNQLAQAPGNAINNAQEALAARRAGEQSRVDAVVAGEDLPDRPARKAPSVAANKPPAGSSAVSTMTPVAPGLAASAAIEAEAEAGAEFRLLVANLKIRGVFLGEPPRAVINGRLMRVGERIDSDLGVTFEGLDVNRQRLIFKDRTGATIQRKF
jgi:cytoskeletal protein RodZ